MTDLDIARAQATQDIASAVLKAAGAVMVAHGNDPESIEIVAAGFALALQSIGKNIDSRMPEIVRKLLAEE